MQAPTTPNGSPAQEPVERPCPGCGADNGPAAAFCWQCYRPFAPTAAGWAPSEAPSAPAPRTPGPAPSPFPTDRRSNGLGTMAVVVLATLALIGGAWFVFFRDGAVALPGAFGGLSAIDDAQSEAVVSAFKAEVQTSGIDGDMRIYGNGTPTAALVWIRDASVPTTDAAFDAFASGFDEGIGGGSSLGKKQTGEVEGVTYVCAPVLGTAPGTICMWQEDDLFWLLFDFSGGSFASGQHLAVMAHDGVQAT